MVEFSHRRNRNEYLFEDNPEFYLYFGMFFLCALLIITWSYFECTDSESVTKAGFQIFAMALYTGYKIQGWALTVKNLTQFENPAKRKKRKRKKDDKVSKTKSSKNSASSQKFRETL